VLARLEAFLPELKRANEALDPAQASIENQVDEDEDSSSEDESVQGHRDHRDDLEQQYIEMVRVEFCSIVPRHFSGHPHVCRVFFLFYFSSILSFLSLMGLRSEYGRHVTKKRGTNKLMCIMASRGPLWPSSPSHTGE
jgi:hypothetical protein